jgi:hypothetical protein
MSKQSMEVHGGTLLANSEGPTHISRCSTSTCDASCMPCHSGVYGRGLILKSELESSLSYLTFKRLLQTQNAFNTGFNVHPLPASGRCTNERVLTPPSGISARTVRLQTELNVG